MIRVMCPACDHYGPPHLPTLEASRCETCGFELLPTLEPGDLDRPQLTRCRFCGHDEMYIQKDFPHWLGLSILLGAVLASFVTYSYHLIAWTWAILLGSAAIDGLLYYFVGNVTLCYRCLSQHRGYPPNPEHQPFELGTFEKYRQERLRRRQQILAEETHSR